MHTSASRMGSMRPSIQPTSDSVETITATIQDFPTEVLCKIFLLATDGDCFESHRISQVCTHWRNIALSYPRLWHRYVFNRPAEDLQYAPTFLERAQHTPISIICAYPIFSPPNHALSTLITSHFTHTYELTLHGDIRPFIDTPTPILRRCNICTPYADYLILISNLFDGVTPCLAQLTMYSCRLPWGHRQYKNLTHLTVDYGDNIATLTSFTDMMHVFRESPNLEEVNIREEFISQLSIDPGYAVHDLIPLHKLRLMILEIPPAHFSYMVAHIATPPDLTLRWRAFSSRMSIGEPPLFPRDPDCLPLMGRLFLLEIKINPDTVYKAEIAMIGRPILPAYDQRALQPNDEVLNLFFPVIPICFDDLMRSLKHYFCQCFSTLRELRISYGAVASYDISEPPSLRSMFTKFPGVERLSIVLNQSSEHDESPLWGPLVAKCKKPGVVLFPALQHLTIRETIIRGTAVDFLCMWLPRLDGLLTVHLEECRFEDEDVWRQLRDELQQNCADKVTCAISGCCAHDDGQTVAYTYVILHIARRQTKRDH